MKEVVQTCPGARDGHTDACEGLYFNGMDTIKKKIDLAFSEHLGGVMLWEVGQDMDDPGSLLQGIREHVEKKSVEARQERERKPTKEEIRNKQLQQFKAEL